MQVDEDLLWGRIQDRLKQEPKRLELNEDSKDWMLETLDFYNSFAWDYELENNENTIWELVETAFDTFKSHVPAFEESLPEELHTNVQRTLSIVSSPSPSEFYDDLDVEVANTMTPIDLDSNSNVNGSNDEDDESLVQKATLTVELLAKQQLQQQENVKNANRDGTASPVANSAQLEVLSPMSTSSE
eukprot:TRINITY_DN7647_c0_g1_i1.p1 TRINITY_DN7647_c0_g1~~TRINITY_DN7647_c0_g1_i1.p1  ORF type:complete len:187 (+),score=81.45 TRINITY_DN7647_c0_g1_i1:198-758(+)